MPWRWPDAEREANRQAFFAGHEGPVWVFAYGSLMWDPAILFDDVRPALLEGYSRAMCLVDRRGARGSAEAPGLMAELMDLIRSYGLPESFMGDLITFSVTVLLVLLGLFLNGALSKFLDRRLNLIRHSLSWDDKRFSSIFRIQRWAGYVVSLILIGYASWHLIASSMGKEESEGPGSLLSAVDDCSGWYGLFDDMGRRQCVTGIHDRKTRAP